jgi:PleD family two-component response regulator
MLLMENERLYSRRTPARSAITHLLIEVKAISMTLLIVDDSREMRQLMKSIVSKVCHEVFECEDGEEVRHAFTFHRPDWVLMDVEMKRMDGLKRPPI